MERNANYKIHRALQALLFAVLLGADQCTKYLAVTHIKGQSPFVVLQGVLEFSYWENTGAAFSSFQGMNMVLIFANLLLIVALGITYIRLPVVQKWLPLQYTLIVLVAGGLGNLVDRIVHGYVIDFVYVTCINFPKFNLADSYIVVSIISLFILVLFVYKDNEIFETLTARQKKK